MPLWIFRMLAFTLAAGLVQPVAAQTLQDAAEQIRPLAEQGQARWQYFLGSCYDNGIGGVSQDYPEALKWYRKAAEQGYGDALAGMAGMYAGGYGVPKNYVLAEMYVELAEAQHAKTDTLKMTRAVVRQHVTSAQTAEAKKQAAACQHADFKGCEKM